MNGWKKFKWIVDEDLFKFAAAAYADLTAYAEMKHDRPEIW